MKKPDPSAESLFAHYLDAKDDGKAERFERLCTEHPRHMAELRRMLYDWRAARLSQFGASGETVSVLGEQSDPNAWSEFLERLRHRSGEQSRYQDSYRVGEGAMGKIDAVFDEDLRRTLARKVLKEEPDGRGSSGRLGRFLEEAQVTAQLDHPGIVPVHELGIDDRGNVYFTMKLVKGVDLKTVFARVKSGADGWNRTRALSTLLRACEALAFAHDKGVIHRDLKPSNIMVGRFGETYVMDWGLARVDGRADHRDLRPKPAPQNRWSVVETDRKTHDSSREFRSDSPIVTMDGDVVGTPFYMPPEQAAGKLDELGPHSDVYALGAILYELLAGQAPYEKPGTRVSPHTVLGQVLDGPPKSLSMLAPAAPPELAAICERAMVRASGLRYATMKDLAGDLRAYLENRVVAAYESGTVAEFRKWVARNRGLALTAVAAFLATLIFAAWALKERNLARFSAQIARSNESTARAESQRADQNAREARTRTEEAVRRKEEAEARKSEFDQLASVVALNETLAKEAGLYPAWPELIEPMERWLAEDTARLLQLKPLLAQSVAELEQSALPQTPQERQQDIEGHSRFRELRPLSRQVDALRLANTVREIGAPTERARLPTHLAQSDARSLNRFAWSRVTPDISERIYGEETLALAAARLAVQRIDEGDVTVSRSSLVDTQAWALFSVGLDRQAVEASRQALAAASPADKASFTASLERLARSIASAKEDYERVSSSHQALLAEVSRRRIWRFADDSQRFLHDGLSKLPGRLATFEARQVRQVSERLSWARRIEDLTLRHPNARVTWKDAHDAIDAADNIVASELYRGRPPDLKPQWGLIPMGMNPVTKLWEFYHLRSAWDPALAIDPADLPIPEHAEDGSIEILDGTGIVFVLIPGVTFRMGAQRYDPEAPQYDPQAGSDESPLHEVTLSEYFVARHELTMGQWYRLSGGKVPSSKDRDRTYYGDPTPFGWTHPVDGVSWTMCDELLAQHGLALPTEAQWEYAARGTTETVWWTGFEASSLERSANVLDVRAEKQNPGWGRQEGDFIDGYVSSAPVGRFRPNPFGLFDVCGNAEEWCRDWYDRYIFAVDKDDGERELSVAGSRYRIRRGGGYTDPADLARSASRSHSLPTARYSDLGLRPARAHLK